MLNKEISAHIDDVERQATQILHDYLQKVKCYTNSEVSAKCAPAAIVIAALHEVGKTLTDDAIQRKSPSSKK